MTIRVMLADDQEMIRMGLRMICDAQADLEVVGEAADGVAAVTLARALRPDVCLVDVRMPLLDGLGVTRALAGPGVPDPLRVVIVTTFDLDEYVDGALAAGAAGFVLKGAAPALLLEAIRAAHAGDSLISPEVTVRLLQRLATDSPIHPVGGIRPGPHGPAADPGLSPREHEVVAAVAHGRTNAEIAGDLFITLSTVKSHVASIQNKLGARNRVEIAAWAWRSGLLAAAPRPPEG